MSIKSEKLKKIKEEIFEHKPKKFNKKVAIIFDGKQYTIRIPRDYAEKAQIDPDKDVFEFVLEIPEDKTELPMLYGDVVGKEESADQG